MQMAMRDPRAWGPDAETFKIRPLSEYHSKSVGFAEQAIAPHLRSPNSRSCPARDLSFAMITTFLGAWVHMAEGTGKPVMQAWKPHLRKAGTDGSNIDDIAVEVARPEDVKMSEKGAPSMTLRLDSNLEAAGRTGDERIAALDERDRRLLHLRARVDNKFDKHTDLFTKAWATLVLVFGQQPAASIEVRGTELFPKRDYVAEGNMIAAPFGGIQICKVDEDDIGEWLTAVYRAAFTIANKALPYSEPSTVQGLFYFDTTLEAIAAINATFAGRLPAQFTVWEGLETDRGVADLCTHGLGVWMLKQLDPTTPNRSVPAGAVLEIDISILTNYAVRKPYAPYGHTAFLGPPGADDRCALVGIWVAAERKLLLPGQGHAWEVAKAGFKSSLFTLATLREHLLEEHWIISNGLSRAAREATGPDHPIRRLLRPHYYNTAAINRSAVDTLMPVGSLGYRMFAFTPESWMQMMGDFARDWQWCDFPNRMANAHVADVHPTLPLLNDGLLIWDAMLTHVERYLAVFYESDAALQADGEAVAFWRHFATQTDRDGWQLGELTLGSLARFLAGLIFEVTVGHEAVGAIVEFLMTPNGTAGKLAPGKTQPDVQSLALVLATISLTGIPQPQLLDDWEHIYRGAAGWSARQHDKAVRAERKFQHALELVAQEIEDRNGERESRGARRYLVCNPRILEASVSI
jgi:hypothetical protein